MSRILIIEEDMRREEQYRKKLAAQPGLPVDMVTTRLAGYIRLAGAHGYTEVILQGKKLNAVTVRQMLQRDLGL